MTTAMRPVDTVSSWVADRVRAHTPLITLRDYQDDAIDAVAHAVQVGGRRRVVVVLPTGAGKSAVFSALARGWLADEPSRVLVLAHRDELITQAVANLAMWMPRHLIGVVKAERDEVDSPAVVASIQTLARPNRLERVGQFGLIIYDEVHHAAAASSRTVLSELGVFQTGGPVLVGVTATPKRADGVRLDDIFEGDPVYSRTITEMQALGHLVPIVGRAYQLLATTSKPRMGIDGDYAAGWSETMMLGANAPTRIVEAWKESASGLKTLVFTPTVSVAKAVASSFSAAGVAAEWVSGEMSTRDRQALIQRFKDGDTQVVANCSVWGEGFDEPSIECIVLGKPTRSQTAYLQMLGRGLRPFDPGGKTHCTVIDLVGIVGQMDLDAALDLRGKDLEDTAEPVEIRKKPGSVPFGIEDGRLVGSDLAVARQKRGRWVNLRDGWWALRILPTRGQGESSGGWLTLEPDDEGTWVVRRRGSYNAKKTIHEGLSQEYAFGIAEGVAIREGKLFQVGERAKWLDRPISEASLRYRGKHFGATPEWTAWQLMVAEAEAAAQRWKAGR